MKIAVISSYAWINIANNYGALLQYFALQKYLENRGHNVYWIRTVIPKGIREKIRSLIPRRNIRLWYMNRKCHKSFMAFTREYLGLSESVYSGFDEINQNPPEADYYITGSDQVWGGTLKENYLLFVRDNSKKIAYAASFGKSQISNEQKAIVEPWIKEFRAVSVREDSGVDICKSMGIESQQLLDPTLLIPASEYPAESSKDNVYYYFCYFLNISSSTDVRLKSIESFIDKNNSRLKIAAVQGAEHFIPSKYYVSPSPTDWLMYYKNAKGIITNTFHGTVFAIIFHRPFAVILQNGSSSKQNGRLFSLLKMFHLEDRIWGAEKNLDELLKSPIDWEYVEVIKREWISKTDKYFNCLGL